MLKELDDSDWSEAFGYAGEPDTCATKYQDGPKVTTIPLCKVSTALFTREDVVEIAAMDPGENDERPWMIYGRLRDGRWFYLEAGCDYTGWDCRASGSAVVAPDRASCERLALTDEARERLKVALPEDGR